VCASYLCMQPRPRWLSKIEHADTVVLWPYGPGRGKTDDRVRIGAHRDFKMPTDWTGDAAGLGHRCWGQRRWCGSWTRWRFVAPRPMKTNKRMSIRATKEKLKHEMIEAKMCHRGLPMVRGSWQHGEC
jgi:hypothetical protein